MMIGYRSDILKNGVSGGVLPSETAESSAAYCK